jgi:hypothetical protein
MPIVTSTTLGAEGKRDRSIADHIARLRSNGIEVVMLQRPPVNAMDLGLLEGLKEVFAAVGR